MKRGRTSDLRGRGFSLVELLVVMAVIVMLLAVAVPALNSVLAGSSVSRAGQMISDAFVLARQEAISKNQDVYVRFLRFADGVDPTAQWRAVQVWTREPAPDGSSTGKSIGKLMKFPGETYLSTGAALSPLLERATDTGSLGDYASYENVSFAGFRFRATGQIDGSLTNSNWVTVRGATDQADPPRNYYTVQINPITGKVLTYRPSL